PGRSSARARRRSSPRRSTSRRAISPPSARCSASSLSNRMACCHYYAITEGHESAFAVDVSSIVFGPGALKEAGEHARALGMKRAALFTDRRVGALEHVADCSASLRSAGVDVAIYDEVKVEPTDESFRAASLFAAEGR